VLHDFERKGENMNKRLLTIIIALMLFAIVAIPVTAAQSGYIQIQGITGGCNGGEKLAGYCVINGFQHEVSKMHCGPLGACTANFTLSIVKPLDAASPKFLQAAANGMVLKTVTIRYLQPGSSASFYVINLSNARIVYDLQSFDPLSPPQSATGPLELISFKFETITWKWEPHTPICWDLRKNSICSPSV
jgi:type VI secretion system Hcp family effector